MKYTLFTEVLTIGLFIAYYFDWHKIRIRTCLSFRRFLRAHFAQRVDPDFDLNLAWLPKVQPTGDKLIAVYPEFESKFIIGCDPVQYIDDSGITIWITYTPKA